MKKHEVEAILGSFRNLTVVCMKEFEKVDSLELAIRQSPEIHRKYLEHSAKARGAYAALHSNLEDLYKELYRDLGE